MFALRAVAPCLALLAACQAHPDLDEYQVHRERFLARQRRMRSDEGSARQHLTDADLAADAVLSSLRADLRANMSDVLATPLRAMKRAVRDTKLFSLLHEMPKGAQLHSHTDTLLPLDVVLRSATYRPHCHIYWNAPEGQGLAWFAATGTPKGSVHFYTEGTAPAGWEPAASLRQRIPSFDDQLLAHWDVLRYEVVYNETTDPWGPFQRFFSMLDGAYLYRPFFEDYNRMALLNVVDNWKSDYIEIRCLGYQTTLYDTTQVYSMEETVAIFQQVVDSVKALRPSFVGAGLIYSQFRKSSVDDVRKSLADAYNLRQKFPDFVVGYDLVGQEDAGEPLSKFIGPLLEYADRLDYFFHAGETDQNGDDTTAVNINDAVLLQSRRIGHGLAMAKLPLAAEYATTHDIAIEINVLSNQGLQFVLDVRNHPGLALMAQGVPLVICNDDPAILDTADSMGYDWFFVYMAWDMDIASVKQLAINSIRYSAAPADTKRRLYDNFSDAWDAWAARLAAMA